MTVEQIKEAVRIAHDMRENSWTKGERRYRRSWEECFEKACNDTNLPKEMARLLVLVNHWYNDLRDWAGLV